MDLKNFPFQLILGSQSPRRKELLAALDIPFEIRVSHVDEVYPADLPKKEVPEFLANLKLQHLLQSSNEGELFVCSDTIVLLGDKIYEKAANKEEAAQMLRELSNNTHTVITSVAMGTKRKQAIFSDETQVTFKTLMEAEIDYYLDHYKPFDKAGSYGVQEWIGMIAITKMEGSFYTVMGLPVHQVYQALKNW
ncbi:MAG: Maf family nucleotide pyrophosphatase [Crocinitomicaceae bacterium]|jgi:septum formation protein|nr:Maf family nucleotide pyrophosphatase [Crocinitomicaceae bacterium]